MQYANFLCLTDMLYFGLGVQSIVMYVIIRAKIDTATVSANNRPTERISQLVDHFFHPLVSKTKSYVKDTTNFLNPNYKNTYTPTSRCAVDTNITNLEGISACQKHLNNHLQATNQLDALPHLAPLMHLLDSVLTKNNFDFNEKHYLQIGGTAMGTRIAPSLPNLFMAEFEEKHVYPYPTKPKDGLLYIDDIFIIIWEHGQLAPDSFLEQLKSCHESIKFTEEHSLLTTYS